MAVVERRPLNGCLLVAYSGGRWWGLNSLHDHSNFPQISHFNWGRGHFYMLSGSLTRPPVGMGTHPPHTIPLDAFGVSIENFGIRHWCFYAYPIASAITNLTCKFLDNESSGRERTVTFEHVDSDLVVWMGQFDGEETLSGDGIKLVFESAAAVTTQVQQCHSGRRRRLDVRQAAFHHERHRML